MLCIHGKVLSDMVVKLNLAIANICKSNNFLFIDNNNISMKFLYKDGLISYILVKNYLQRIFISVTLWV